MNIIKELFSKYNGSIPMGFSLNDSSSIRRPLIFNTGEGDSDAVCVLHGQNIDKVEAEIKGMYLDTPCTCTTCKSAEVPFIVFRPQNMPLSIDFSQNTSKIILVDVDANINDYSAYASLPVDAIMLFNENRLTWISLSYVKRFSALGKPVIVQVPADATIEELQKLYKAGAMAFMIMGNSSDVHQQVLKAKWQLVAEKKDAVLGSSSCTQNCAGC